MPKPLKRSRRSNMIWVAAVLGPILTGTAGCAVPAADTPSTHAAVPAIIVTRLSRNHTIELDQRGAVSDLERRRLLAFVADRLGDRPEAAHALVDGAAPDDALKAIAASLKGYGVHDVRIKYEESGSGSSASQVVVTIETYSAKAPPCAPYWSGPVAGDDNGTRADLGCANAANLAAMVADPHDLIAGSGSNEADGRVAAYAVERYENQGRSPAGEDVRALPADDRNFQVGGGSK